ncbi:MAG TPA: hypothetical protein VHO69_04345 [Phototrophicaceae bacterium]|nr:hypothetical protein [Phototrophicaceae bacterium]
MIPIDELLPLIFESLHPALQAEFAAWVRASKPFRAFAEDYRGKIRKKLRTVQDADALKDLRLELEIAYRLVGEKRFTVKYEQSGVGKQRAPDFQLLFRENTPLNVEVTRLRFTGGPSVAGERPIVYKLMETMGDKVGQMAPGMINVLLIGVEIPVVAADLAAAGKQIKLLADQKQEAFFTRRGFANAADFLRQYAHLSAVIARRTDSAASQSEALLIWLNPNARHPLPKDIQTALERALTPPPA